jgi:hypothetical protein
MQILQTLSLHQYPEVGREPGISFGSDNFLVVWSQGEFGGESHVRAARVSPAGAVLDTGVICGMDHYSEYRPSVAFDGDRFLVVWYNYVELPAGIFGRFVDQNCVPANREFQIRDLPVNTSNDPDIAFLDSVYLVVWNEPSPSADDNVYGQIVSKDGILIGNEIPIAIDTMYQYQARVVTADSLFLVVWNQEAQVFGQFVTQDGSLSGSNFPISDPEERPRDFPDVAYGNQQFLVVWHEFRNDDHGIYGDLDVSPWIRETHISPYHNGSNTPTIITGAFYIPSGCTYQVYDIMGRQVHDPDPAPGIYFIEIDGSIVHKIVKIK